jgi:uncharacterized protein YneF (UPF0154 family)
VTDNLATLIVVLAVLELCLGIIVGYDVGRRQ